MAKNRLFDINSLGSSEPVNSDKLKVMQFERSHMLKIDNLKSLSGMLPSPGEMFFLETTNSFNAFTFITYILKEKGCIDELFVATYSINQRILNSLQNYINKGALNEVNIYISETIKHRNPTATQLLESFNIAYPFFRLQYAYSHKKITCIRCGEEYFVIEGSGNFSENAAEEQYLFVNSKELYEFRKPDIRK